MREIRLSYLIFALILIIIAVYLRTPFNLQPPIPSAPREAGPSFRITPCNFTYNFSHCNATHLSLGFTNPNNYSITDLRLIFYRSNSMDSANITGEMEPHTIKNLSISLRKFFGNPSCDDILKAKVLIHYCCMGECDYSKLF